MRRRNPAPVLSPVFTSGIEHHALTKVHRNAGAITTIANQVRVSGLERPRFHETLADDRSEVRVHPGRRSWLKDAINLAAELDNNQTDQFRLLTFTRKAAAGFGDRVHARRYGKGAPRFVEGQRLITLDAVANPDDPRGFTLANSTVEFEVLSATSVPRRIPYDEEPWPVWTITGRSAVDGTVFTCHVLEDSKAQKDRYNARLALLREQGKEHGGRAWFPYYSLQAQFAQIGYWWAITVHRSQGRQYEQVWLDLENIDACTKDDLDARRRLIYVGLTRAERIAHVVADVEVQG